jgi:hypothetical protein
VKRLIVTLALFIAACSGTDTMEPDSDAGADAGNATTPDTGNNTAPDSGNNTTPTTCGNGMVDEGELCEPFMLEGETCATQGFSAGTLACNATCDGYDTSGCNRCNNGTVDDGEQCDGLDLAGATCESLGFDTGMLRCVNCFWDTDACEITTCGNGQLDAGEQCDGDILAGQTCAGEGFDGGDLGCTANCRLDTSACTTCGDGMVTGDEECDGADLGGATCVGEGFNSGTIACSDTCTLDVSACATCGDGVVSGDEDCDGTEFAGATCQTAGFDAGDIGCTATCTFDTTACTALPKPAVGEVVVSEFMPDPDAISDNDGEWFELVNLTANELSLSGCEFRDSSNTYTVPGGTTIGAGAYFTVATSAMPGFTPDIGDLSFGLNNGGDDIEVWCDDGSGTLQLVDGVTYDGGPNFPDPTGASIQFDADLTIDGTVNDVAANYCAGRTAYGSSDLGTPGGPNESCAFCGDGRVSAGETCDGSALGSGTCTTEGFDTGTLACDANCQYDTAGCANFTTIGFCRLQAPLSINETAGTTVTIAGRVQSLGVTDLTDATDTTAALVAELGWGPDGTDPATNASWTWQAAGPNTTYDATAAGGEADVDEYETDLLVPSDTGSPYDYAYRFSGDAGATWTYCDSDETTPLTTSEYGQMVATAPVVPVLYFSQYVEGGGSNKALEIYNGGSTAADLSTCGVNTYSNGSSSPNGSGSFLLSGTLAPGAVYTVCNPNASEPGLQGCDLTPAANPQFNGDDAVELVCDGFTLDVIGQIGFDPGTEWSDSGVGTEDQSLERLCTVTSGDSNGADAFVPSAEWTTSSWMGAAVGSYTCP